MLSVESSRIRNLFDQTFNSSLLRGDVKDPSDFIGLVFEATHELAAWSPKILANENAVKILKAFDLDILMDPKLPTNIAKSLTNLTSSNGPLGHNYYDLVTPIARAWKTLAACVEPIEQILIPHEISDEKISEDIITLEIRRPGDEKPDAATLAATLTSLEQLYESVVHSLQSESVPPLRLVFVTSGSNIRFDLKGIGDAVKHIKDLFIEGWEKIRHRKADDFKHNTKAALEGLHALEVLANHREVDPETKQRLNYHIVGSMLELFKAGALPREIQPVELVSNDLLLLGVQQKLLPAPNVPSREVSPQPQRTKRPLRKAKKRRK